MGKQLAVWHWLGALLFFAFLPVGAQAQRPLRASAIAGTWVGSWKGTNTATFEIKIAQADKGKLTGELKATLDGEGDLTAQFNSVVLTGNRLSLKLVDEAAEIELVFEIQVRGTAWTGTYTLRGKGADAERGTLTARKKA